jgi:PAS domain S-box-containing protein
VFRTVMTVLLFAAAFYVLELLTATLRFLPVQITTIWPPGALLFTALLLVPPHRWWVYYVGLCLGVFASFYGDTALPAATAMLAAQFHFAAVALGAWQVRRFGVNQVFGNLTSVLAFFVIAVVLVSVTTVAPIHVVLFFSGANDIWPVFVRDVLSVGLGMLIVTPALTLTVANGRAWLLGVSWRRLAAAAALAAALVGAGYLIFVMPRENATAPALLYAPLPLLLWAAVRFELTGVSAALVILAYQSTWGAIHGRGPFASEPPADSVLQLQFFLLAISLPLMVLATAMRERGQASSALATAEQELRREYAQFRLVVESMPNGIVMVNAEGAVVLVNSQCEKFFGYRRDELLGQPVEALVPERFRPKHPGYRAAFFASPSARPMGRGHDLFGRRKDGSEFPVEVGLTPVQASEGLLVLCAIVDITARKQAEEARQELAHASRLALVGELTASIAHEINQPLGAIQSYADAAGLLLKSSPPALDQVQEILGNICKDDLRASEVIRRLRALLSKRQIEIQPVDLNELASDVVLFVRTEARRRGIKVESELGDDVPLIPGDKVHLQQVLLNLLLNGMDAMADVPGERRLTVRTGVNGSGFAEIAVSDIGPGILPDRLPRLFDPFFSTKNEGMGLGLSIARSLVEAHGGHIWAENNVNGGATFRITLPTGREQPRPVSPSTPQAPAGASV